MTSNVYVSAGLPEWVSFHDRPDLGHHPDPSRPTHTRCGMNIEGSSENACPRFVHTDCLPRATATADATPDPADLGLFDGTAS